MRALVSLTILTVALFYGTVAQPHTGLVHSVPANGASEKNSPADIELVFGAEVRLVDIRLSDGEGKSVELTTSRMLTPAIRFQIPVPTLAAGNYTVDWVVMGGDSHKMTGGFVFTVEANAPQ